MPFPPNLRCGPSGWSYPHWNGTVYPKSKPHAFHALEYLSRYFDAVEINTSFYQHLRPEISALWVSKVANNPKFLFTAKLNREFTHNRNLRTSQVAAFKDGMWPLLRAGKLGCILMQFPWTFRYTRENRKFLIELRREFHEFRLVAEMRHASWMYEEAVGTLIDYRIGFCNIDQAEYMKAMPPTALLTSETAYVRLHGRNPRDWQQEFQSARRPAARHDYLYSEAELREWQCRIERVAPYADRTFVFANNDAGAKAVVNALQISAMLGDERRRAPADLLRRYRCELDGFHSERPLQPALFASSIPAPMVA
jgi:uncharacterized protein YecE (DUF72 family)